MRRRASFPSGLPLYRDGSFAQVATVRFCAHYWARRRASRSFQHARIRRFPKGNPFMTTAIQESAASARAIQPAGGVLVSGLIDLDPKTDGHGLARVNGYQP